MRRRIGQTADYGAFAGCAACCRRLVATDGIGRRLTKWDAGYGAKEWMACAFILIAKEAALFQRPTAERKCVRFAG